MLEELVVDQWKDEEKHYLYPVIAKSFGEQVIVYQDEGHGKHIYEDIEEAKKFAMSSRMEGDNIYSFIVDINKMEIVDYVGGDYHKDYFTQDGTYVG